MKFRLYGWTDVIDEAGEKWEKYAIVKEWTITYETSKKEILDMVEAVKDGNVDIVIDKERDSCLRAADFDRFVEILKWDGWKFLDEPHFDWYNDSAIVFNSKFKITAEFNNFDTYIKEEMEKFKEMTKRWDYI